MKTGTSIIFVNDNDQVLLFLRDNKKGIPYPNCWDVLGGNVEEGETPLQCIIREMKEEIDFDLENPALFRVCDMGDRIEHTFWQKENFDIDSLVLTEGQRLQWFTEKEIFAMTDKELAFGFRAILLDFFDQKPFEMDYPG